MIQARRIGHATFETPDLDKAIDYYTQITGLAFSDPFFGILLSEISKFFFLHLPRKSRWEPHGKIEATG
jgi:catechol 2,3-dioxygenase-like lactoylglutathione lyase family enzyme